MSLEICWPLLQQESRDWLVANDGDALSTLVLDDLARVGGPVPSGAWWVGADPPVSISQTQGSTGSRQWPMESGRTLRRSADFDNDCRPRRAVSRAKTWVPWAASHRRTIRSGLMPLSSPTSIHRYPRRAPSQGMRAWATPPPAPRWGHARVGE